MEFHPIAQHTTGLRVDPIDALDEMAKIILNNIDPKRKKSDMPAPPIVGEIFGMHKSGKDSLIVKIDCWFRARKFLTCFTQESAETKEIRATFPKNPYTFEMKHFSYALGNLLNAAVSRDFHLIFFNRGVVDTLCWLEKHYRAETITGEQYKTAWDFILSGPWIQTIDVLVCLICDVDTSLLREFGPEKPKRYGSRMNPGELTLMRECVLSVCEKLKTRFPDLPLIQIDTTSTNTEEVSRQVISFILKTVKQRLELREDEMLPHSIALLRERAWITGPELKLHGTIDHETLRHQGWRLEASTKEIDIYIKPKNKTFLQDGECFHLRKSAGKVYFVYQSSVTDPRHRAKIHIPIPADCEGEVLSAFDVMDTVEKERETFSRGGYLLNRDKVKGLGDFTEIKAIAFGGEDVLMNIASELGFTDEAICTETYVRLHRKRKNNLI